MGYILKTNNRKKLSGCTLQAKIVSPDKKDVVYREYPIEVQVQQLSARERVMRDMQQLDAILSQNNDWSNVTKINELGNALNSASYCYLILKPFENDSDDDGLIINSSGDILRQPVYGSSDFATALTILVKDKIDTDVQETYRKPFIIPAYTADNIIGNLKQVFNNSSIWNLIKKDNTMASKIHSDLNRVNTTQLFAQTSPQGIATKDMFDADDSSSIPALTMSYPSYYSGLITEDSQGAHVARIDADDMWELDSNSSYTITPLKVTHLTSEECQSLGLDAAYDRGEVVCYAMSSSDPSLNVISGSFTLDGSSLTCDASVSGVRFLSKKIELSQIARNLVDSAKLSWFIPADALTEYDIIDVDAGSTDASHPKTIMIKKDDYGNLLNPVFKVPGSLLDLFQDTDVTDSQHIGYSYDHTTNKLSGFSDVMITTRIQLDNDSLPMHITDTPIDVTQEVIGATDMETYKEARASGGAGSTRYMFLDGRNEFTTGTIKGHITIEFLNTSLGEAQTAVTFYFQLTPET